MARVSAVRTVRRRRAGRRRVVAGAVVMALAGLGLSGCMSVGAGAPDARSGGLQDGQGRAVDGTGAPGAVHPTAGARGRHGALPAADAERHGATPSAEPSAGAPAASPAPGLPSGGPAGTPSTRSVDTPTGPPADGGPTAEPTPTPTPTPPPATPDPDPVPTVLGSSAPSGGSSGH
ncbi:hypothetical protein [Kitasatospora sp. NPDC059571]|uniref:hypothetical protein n=1 Tax=Kitasatospora sp. NPDC059571 TaxID=3346871 RepID=UPI0036C61BF9